jgi:FkbM family methyltransferase
MPIARPSLVQHAKQFAIDHRMMRVRWLRRPVLALLAQFGDGDTIIDHHWVPGRRVRLHRFRHKGYWFYGANREHNIMRGFARLIRPGDTVVALGGHIGYIAVYLAHLAGDAGRVFVFEPSPDNLAYLEDNVAGLDTVQIVRRAVSDRDGRACFFVEGLTGQNSTLVDHYAVFSSNRRNAFSDETYRTVEVETTTLDTYLAENGVTPDFIKIDIEGSELAALTGARRSLERFRPALMVEVTHREDEVMRLMREIGYRAYDTQLCPATADTRLGPNRFFLPEEMSVSSWAERPARGVPATSAATL